jgi:hypothetical protein
MGMDILSRRKISPPSNFVICREYFERAANLLQTEIGYQKPSLFIANLRLQNFNDGEALTKGSANRDSFTRSLKSRSGMTSDDYLVESLARGRFFVHRNLDIRNGFLGARLAPDERSNASRVPAFRRERPTI